MTRGRRDSPWLALRRCLAMVRRLQRGPATRPELVEVVSAEVNGAYGAAEGKALSRRFQSDRERLSQILGIEIKADRRSREYTLRELAMPLLDMPDEDLRTLAFLEQTFEAHSPHHHQIQELVGRLKAYLPEERRLALEQIRTDVILQLGQQDDDRLDPEVEDRLRQALARRLQVEFDYRSPGNESGQPRRHVVDIFEPPQFEPSLGHYYLRGWCHYNVGPEGEFAVAAYQAYRLGRIQNVHFTSRRLPPSPPKPHRHEVRYWLSPVIARGGVTRRRWIEIQQTETQPDGSVIVQGVTDDPFFAVQELMHYRHHCRLLGGPELRQKMEETIRKMADLYQISK